MFLEHWSFDVGIFSCTDLGTAWLRMPLHLRSVVILGAIRTDDQQVFKHRLADGLIAILQCPHEGRNELVTWKKTARDSLGIPFGDILDVI